jgi:hypothetical protein
MEDHKNNNADLTTKIIRTTEKWVRGFLKIGIIKNLGKRSPLID